MLIRKLRLDRGWSQEQLAQMAGISTRTLQRAERGKQASLETLKCLAAVLGVEHSDLTEEAQMNSNNISREERLAMEYVDDLRSFYYHLMIYVIVILGLAIMNLIISPSELWFYWPALFWGIGLAIHAIGTFRILPFFGPEWEKRQFDKRVEELRRKR